MTSTLDMNGSAITPSPFTDWREVAREVGPSFSARAAALDANDSFAHDNYHDLKARRFFSAGIPTELGGGGATHAELCEALRELGRHCGATALAVSMHVHLVATMVWTLRNGGPTAPILQRIAAEQLVLTTNGASDWLDSNGTVERVEGGYLVNAHKRFASGSPAADLLLTSAVYDDPTDGPTVLHFGVPLGAPGVTLLDNWHTMSVRASGSNDIVLINVFVPDQAVSARRPRGVWVPFFNAVGVIAPPAIMSVYLGIGEAARDLAVERAAKKREDPEVSYLVGEIENALVTARMATREAIELCDDLSFSPDAATFSSVVTRKTIATQALMTTVEKSLEVVGGGGMFRSLGLERLVRDMHAMQFHPLQPKRQHRFTGRLALGLDPAA
jgi:alkylation response protein AidB-like acyl-CoA dehydrogenase